MVVLDQSKIKDSNRKRILRHIAKERETTKLDISKVLGISIPTVATILSELIEEGIVEEAGVADSTGGRKPVLIKYNCDSRYSIGVEILKESLKVVIINLDGKIIIDNNIYFNHEEKVNIIDESIKLLNDTIVKLGHDKNKILGVGFSLPGLINKEELILEVAPNFNLRNISFDKIKDVVGLPVFLENEANSGAIAEVKLQEHIGKENVIYISVTEGIGGGIILNNKVYKGNLNRAGEIGHMTISFNGRQCNCGKKGCFETYASNRAVINDYNSISSAKVKSIDEIVEMYKLGESLAVKVLEDYIKYLSVGIVSILFMFNPSDIIIGGEISKYSNIILEKLKENIFRDNSFYKEEDINIIFSSLGTDSNIIGAAYIPIIEKLGL